MHFTQNPIGSDDQLDLQDNAISFDYAMNSPAALWQDRFGKQHKTVQQALKDVGFKPAEFDFVSGGTLGIGDRDKCVFNPADGYWYSWGGKLPYVVPANSSPTPGGAKGWKPVDITNRLLLGALVLRNDNYALRDCVSIVDFGAKPDGVTDNYNSIQAAFNHVKQNPVGVVFIPPGIFLKSDKQPTLVMYNNTTLIGSGANSILLHDDRPENPRRDLLICEKDSDFIAFHNFTVAGKALEFLSTENISQTFSGNGIKTLKITGVKFKELRFMATSFSSIKNVLFSGNTLEHIQRDGARFTNSESVVITDNHFNNVSDDCIAVHTIDAETVPLSSVIISNNVMNGCQGVKLLGGKNIIFTGNIMRRSLRRCLEITVPMTGIEGNSPMFNINISDNHFLDTFSKFGSNQTVLITAHGGARGSRGTLGIAETDTPYNYNNNIGISGKFGVAKGVIFSNNIFARTLKSVPAYTDYGYGQIFDWNTPGLFKNPEIKDDDFQSQGIVIVNGISGLIISKNIFNGQTGGYGIFFRSSGSELVSQYSNILIEGNIIKNWLSLGLYVASDIKEAGIMNINDNSFDLDPFGLLPNRTNNTWVGDSTLPAIQNNSKIKMILRNNSFAHCSSFIFPVNENLNAEEGNLIFGNPDPTGDVNKNQGVRIRPSNLGIRYVITDEDWNSPTYTEIKFLPLLYSSVPPSIGFYNKGHFVKNTDYRILGNTGDKYMIIGWTRLTTGESHVLGVDWGQQCSAIK